MQVLSSESFTKPMPTRAQGICPVTFLFDIKRPSTPWTSVTNSTVAFGGLLDFSLTLQHWKKGFLQLLLNQLQIIPRQQCLLLLVLWETVNNCPLYFSYVTFLILQPLQVSPSQGQGIPAQAVASWMGALSQRCPHLCSLFIVSS